MILKDISNSSFYFLSYRFFREFIFCDTTCLPDCLSVEQEHRVYDIACYATAHILYDSADTVCTLNLVCIKMASILNCRSRDFKHGGNQSNDDEVIRIYLHVDKISSRYDRNLSHD